MPTISLFNNAQDNSAKPQSIDIEEFLESFEDVSVGDAKLAGTAWSPCEYHHDHRKHENAHTCFALVYDLDEDSDQKPGLLASTVETLLTNLENEQINYAVHTTFRDHETYPRRKLRVVLPLAYTVSAAEWKQLWVEWQNLLPRGVKPDSTKDHPGNLFFAPRTPEHHKDRYFCRIVSDRRNLLSKMGVDLSRDAWLDSVRNAKEKRHALNRAAFALAGVRAERGDSEEQVLSDLWPALKAALEQNKRSEPVKDWSAAEYTVRTAVRQAYEQHAQSATDPLTKRVQTEVDEKLLRRAQRDLEKWERRVRSNIRELDTAAFVLGTYVPHALSEERAQACLMTAYERSGSSVARADAESRIAVGLGRGKTKPKGQVSDWQARLRANEAGVFLGSDENVAVVLTDHPEMQGVLRYDLRRAELTVQKQPPWESQATAWPSAFVETDATAIAVWLRNELGASTVGQQRALSVLLSVCRADSFDPMVEYLDGLTWDGVARLDKWAVDCLGAPDTEWSHVAGAKWLISAVARTFDPGCKVDTMLALVGKQGVGKSTALRALVPFDDLFADRCDIHSKDTDQLLARLVILEFSELDGISKKEVNSVKSFLSIQSATSRAAYARVATTSPRRCVFAATTNQEDGFLQDRTGNRRFWPLVCTSCRPDVVRAIRDQLWAEAVVRYRAGEKWWLDEQQNELATAAQDEHAEIDPTAESLRPYLDYIPEEIRGEYLASANKHVDHNKRVWTHTGQMEGNKPKYLTVKQCLELLELSFDKRNEMRVASALRVLNLKSVRVRVDGLYIRAYVR